MTVNQTMHNYKLTSVIFHIGDDLDSNHYICYNMVGVNTVVVVDDNKSGIEMLKDVKTSIEKNGYLLFFFTQKHAYYASDSDDNDETWTLPKQI